MGNTNRVLVMCFEDFKADNLGFSRMITDFVGVKVTHHKIGRPIQERKVECPSKYRQANDLNVSPEFEQALHEFFQKWNKVPIEDFGVDCGWRRQLTCEPPI